jgi:hypothetical protein
MPALIVSEEVLRKWMGLHQNLTTAQRDAITNPLPGELVFNTTTNELEYWDGAAWDPIHTGAVAANLSALSNVTFTAPVAGQDIVFDGAGWVNGKIVASLTTVQRDAIPAPVNGVVIYNTTDNAYEFWNGVQWVAIGSTMSVLTTAQRDAHNPHTGLVIYNSTENHAQIYNGTTWVDAFSTQRQAGTIVPGLMTLSGDVANRSDDTHPGIGNTRWSSTLLQKKELLFSFNNGTFYFCWGDPFVDIAIKGAFTGQWTPEPGNVGAQLLHSNLASKGWEPGRFLIMYLS